MNIKKNILISGFPGVGKTTLIVKLWKALKEHSVAGFYTTEIREGGVRKGFELISSDGRQLILSHVDIGSRSRVGKYGVEVKGFEDLLDSLDLEGSDVSVIVIDEIGKMECLSPKFRQSIVRLLDSRKVVIATIAQKGQGFISQIKKRPDAELYEITARNRDSLESDILSQVEAILGKRKK